MRKLLLALAAAGVLSLAATATPVNAGVFTGLQMPAVESNTIDVRRRCHHHRWSSRWHCRYWHQRWRSPRYWHRRHYYYGPRFYGPGFHYRRYWW